MATKQHTNSTENSKKSKLDSFSLDFEMNRTYKEERAFTRDRKIEL